MANVCWMSIEWIPSGSLIWVISLHIGSYYSRKKLRNNSCDASEQAPFLKTRQLYYEYWLDFCSHYGNSAARRSIRLQEILNMSTYGNQRKWQFILRRFPHVHKWRCIFDIVRRTYAWITNLSNWNPLFFFYIIRMGCYLKMYCAIRGSQAWNSNDSRWEKKQYLWFHNFINYFSIFLN